MLFPNKFINVINLYREYNLCILLKHRKNNFNRFTSKLQVHHQHTSSDVDSSRKIPIIVLNSNSIGNESANPLHKSAQNGSERISSHSNDSITGSTISVDEVEKFRQLSTEWWKVDGPFGLLHAMNRLRVALIRDGLVDSGAVSPANVDGPQPLQGLKILDVGCGGGILTEPLARLGATVTGLDAEAESIEVAKIHSEKDLKIRDRLNYRCELIEDHIKVFESHYDAVIASEVLEHVTSLDVFLDCCVAALRPGGSFFATTINRTPQSYLGAIMMAEHVLRIVPAGTHSWDKFIQPEELKDMLKQRSLNTRLLHGMILVPGLNRWCWSRDTSINYALHALGPTIVPTQHSQS